MATKKKTTAKKAAPKPATNIIQVPTTQWEVTGGEVDVRVAFPIPVLEIQWGNADKLNAALELALYQERSEDHTGIYRSNTAGCWHSKTDLFQRDKAGPYKMLEQMFAQGFEQMARTNGKKEGFRLGWDLRAWGMMYRDRGYATPHNHPNCHFAGVYYVRDADQEAPKVMATGDRVKPGTLEFNPPIQHDVWGEWANLAPTARVTPKEGKMVIFPSWLFHMVHPVEGDDTRIAIACNATVRKYDKPVKED